MNKQFYMLGCLQIIYLKDGLRKSQPFNVLLKSATPFVSRKALENFQQMAQIRFMKETNLENKFQVKDAYIENIIVLGHMTNEEFHAGYPEASIVDPGDLVNSQGSADLIPDQEEQAAMGIKTLPEQSFPVSKAEQILAEASDTLQNRAADRDVEQERSMAHTVRAFNAMFDKDLTEEEGWQFMVLLKMRRARTGAFRMDDPVDQAAYSALAGEAKQKAEYASQKMPWSEVEARLAK